MNNQKISIVVPVYNIEKYIKQCIESVLIQNYSNWELILVNDGSTDQSGIICNQFAEKDNRIKTINQSNKGVSSARNVGIIAATGKYITFLDGDDYWVRADILSEIAASDADLTYMTCIRKEYPNGRVCEISNTNISLYLPIKESLIEFFASSLQGNWSCYYIFVKNNIIKDNSIYFDENAKIGEDVDWFFRVCGAANNVSFISEVYYNYRVLRQGSAMTHKSAESISSFFEVVKKWNYYSKMDKRYHSAYIALCNNSFGYLNAISLFPHETREKLINALKSSGAYDDARNKFAIKSRKVIGITGMNLYLDILEVYYRTKKFGSYLKSRL